jgi:hypothetical protein
MCRVTYQAPVGMPLHQNLDEVRVTVVWKWALLRLSPHLAHMNIYFSSPINKIYMLHYAYWWGKVNI